MSKKAKSWNQAPILIGWREWCSLPHLGIPAIKAKIDTGARTSAIHAYNITRSKKQGKDCVKFFLHPLQANDKVIIECSAFLLDMRDVMSSNGHIEHRYVIHTALQLGPYEWEIELTLSNRDPLRYRLLLGREALKNRVIIDPAHSLRTRKISRLEQQRLY